MSEYNIKIKFSGDKEQIIKNCQSQMDENFTGNNKFLFNKNKNK